MMPRRCASSRHSQTCSAMLTTSSSGSWPASSSSARRLCPSSSSITRYGAHLLGRAHVGDARGVRVRDEARRAGLLFEPARRGQAALVEQRLHRELAAGADVLDLVDEPVAALADASNDLVPAVDHGARPRSCSRHLFLIQIAHARRARFTDLRASSNASPHRQNARGRSPYAVLPSASLTPRRVLEKALTARKPLGRTVAAWH